MRFILISLISISLALSAEKAPSAPAPVKVHITLGDLAQANPSLGKLFGFDLPVKTAWVLGNTVTVVKAELMRFEDHRMALIKKHGNEEKGVYTVPPERIAAFSEDFKKLSEIAVDLNIEPISISLFGDNVKLSASDMAHLKPFLVQ